MDTNAYLVFLLLGVLMVAADGQIIYRSGRRYLEESYGDAKAGASMTRLVTVLFHLVALGVLALLSTINIGGSSIQGVVGRLGVMLLVLAVVHGVALTILARIRDEQTARMLAARGAADRAQQGPVVNPVSDQQAASRPSVSPSLEHQAPYSTPES